MRLFDLKSASYGAIADGNTHPLSERYATLAAAQAFYPAALSLFEEIDYNAYRKANNDAKAALPGAILDMGTGSYVINNVNAPEFGLVIPESRLVNYGFTPKGATVNIQGDGPGLASFKWLVEPTTLRFAYSCGDPTGTRSNALGRYAASPAAQFDCWSRGFTLIGPWAAQAETSFLGVVPGAGTFQGMAWGDRHQLTDIDIVGFYAGLNIVGGQALLTNVRSYRNFYNHYTDEPSASNFGDITYRRCSFNGARKAAFGIHVEATLLGSHFQTCGMGAAPYVFWKEGGTGTLSTWQTMLNNVRVSQCQFEFVGNALMGEGNATKIGQAYQTKFEPAYFSWSNTYKIAAEPRNAIIDIAKLENFEWQILDPQNLAPGVDATIKVTSCVGVKFSGNIQKMLDTAESAGKPFLHSSAGFPSDRRVTFEDSLGWSGHLAYLYNTGTLHDVSAKYGAGATGAQKGAVLCWGGSNPSVHAQLMDNSDDRPMVGVCAVSSPHSNYVPVIDTTRCAVAFAVQGTDVIGSGMYMKLSVNDGYVVQGSSSTDGRPVGYAQANASGTSPARTAVGYLAARPV